ncbi:MAG: hypothetical protein J6K15_06260 [Lachnospiraceae bacterium]|nr:hypothetical protein [Lachnospiraceae bacterium]
MGKLMIDEVIGHCERTVERFEKQTSRVILENIPLREPFMKEYWEHRQVAEWLKELQAFKDKQEQGLLIELPVPLGTEVYKVVEDKTAATIETIKHNGHEYRRTIPCYFVCRDLFAFSMLNEVGKTVFLTLDEARKAEEALARMGGSDGRTE